MARALMTTFALVGLLAACGGQGTSEAETEAAPTAEAPAAAPAAASLLDPNLATGDELAAVPGMTSDLASALEAGRPYLRVAHLNAVVSQHLDAEAATALYEHLWLGINLNDVTEEEILLIPGVGSRMAHEFEEYRPYAAMAEFRREIGKYVDDAEVERLATYVFVPIDLNTASREDILAIPGVGERMAHEFEEYRPYGSIEQFRREIGKYVDDAEVARLERYVVLN